MSKTPEDFSTFYNAENLKFDYILTRMCYEKFKPFFSGPVALECGPATGYMTKYLVNDFKKLYAIEGAATLLDKIPDYKNIIKVKSLFENYKPKIKFDTIILNHVLEHIENPVHLLKKMREWISEKGVICVGVPNAKSFHRLAAVKMGLLKTEYELNERDKKSGHYRVYDFNLLKQHAIESGYEIINMGGVFIKFLSNYQMEQFFSEQMIQAFFEISESCPENCAVIYVILKKNTANDSLS